MSDRVVYHYTDSLHLPWIVKSSELRPNTNRLVGIGLIKYLWATTNPAGDKTARAMITMHKGYEELFQHGLVQLIRFTLPSAGFVPWCDIKRESNWTRGQIRKLQQSDRKYFDEHGFAKWRCRREPLPITSALKVEAKLWEKVGGKSRQRANIAPKYPTTRRSWLSSSTMFTTIPNNLHPKTITTLSPGTRYLIAKSWWKYWPRSGK